MILRWVAQSAAYRSHQPERDALANVAGVGKTNHTIKVTLSLNSGATVDGVLATNFESWGSTSLGVIGETHGALNTFHWLVMD